MRITFLGTGTSHGVPMLDCMLSDYVRCPNGVCLKAQSDPRYRRTRSSILVETEGLSLLIDTSQDFRQQMFANQVRRIDAVLFTHAHADHIFGLPDIRSYCHHQGGPIDVYGSQETIDALIESFSYIFRPHGDAGGGIPTLLTHTVDGAFCIGKTAITPLPVIHGSLKGAHGYRVGNVAYIPDVKAIPESTFPLLEGLDLLILNCLRYRPHHTHLSLQESLTYAERIAPRRCLFTHLAHDIDFITEEPNLPPWARFALDSMTVELDDDGR